MLSLITLLLILLFCSAFFSGSETALFSLSRVQLHGIRELRSLSARKLLRALKRPRETLVTILLGNEFVNISISIVGAAIINRSMRSSVESETLVAVATVTPLVLVFGEIIPKNISLRFAPQLAQVVIWPLKFFHGVIAPLRIVLTWFADTVVRSFGGRPEELETMVMEEEFRKLVDLGRKEGVIVEAEREIIHKVFDFTDKVVSDIMTPVERMFLLDVALHYDRLMEEVKSTQFSRVPFYEGERSNIVGVLHVRALLPFHRRRLAGDDVKIRDHLKPVLFVETDTPLEKLMGEFQRTHVHLAIIRDDDVIRGLVTMDDVLEELFGEIEE